jgi:hypothetical protein
MRFINYCLVVMGDTKNVLLEIEKISETKPNVLDAKGVLIATFSSVASPQELTNWFTENNRNFLIFDLDKNVSGFNITKKNIHDGLFGFLSKIDLNSRSEELLRALDLSSNTITNITGYSSNIKITQSKEKYPEINVSKMTSLEKKELMDRLIDNGVDKLSEDDKKLLQLLAK